MPHAFNPATCEPTTQNFRKFVDFLFTTKREGPDGFMHAASGFSGEAGEVLDHMKKHWVYERDLDIDKVMEEMGDALHYFYQLMIKLEEVLEEPVDIEDIILDNMTKLRKRYPNGFTKEAAIARADKS